jgi:hypothetical protein
VIIQQATEDRSKRAFERSAASKRAASKQAKEAATKQQPSIEASEDSSDQRHQSEKRQSSELSPKRAVSKRPNSIQMLKRPMIVEVASIRAIGISERRSKSGDEISDHPSDQAASEEQLPSEQRHQSDQVWWEEEQNVVHAFLSCLIISI